MKNNFVKSIYRKHLSAASSRCGMTRPQTNSLLMKFDKMTEAGDCAKSYEALAETYCSQYSTEAPKAEIASVEKELQRCLTSHPGINTNSKQRVDKQILMMDVEVTGLNDGKTLTFGKDTAKVIKMKKPTFINNICTHECTARVGNRDIKLQIEIEL